MTPTELTERQREVVSFINRFRAAEQCNPTCVEIANHFGWVSPNAASDHLKALSKKGAVMIRKSKARGYIVLPPYQVCG